VNWLTKVVTIACPSSPFLTIIKFKLNRNLIQPNRRYFLLQDGTRSNKECEKKNLQTTIKSRMPHSTRRRRKQRKKRPPVWLTPYDDQDCAAQKARPDYVYIPKSQALQCSAMCATTGRRCQNQASVGLDMAFYEEKDHGTAKRVISSINLLCVALAYVDSAIATSGLTLHMVVGTFLKPPLKTLQTISSVVPHLPGLSGACCQLCMVHAKVQRKVGAKLLMSKILIPQIPDLTARVATKIAYKCRNSKP